MARVEGAPVRCRPGRVAPEPAGCGRVDPHARIVRPGPAARKPADPRPRACGV